VEKIAQTARYLSGSAAIRPLAMPPIRRHAIRGTLCHAIRGKPYVTDHNWVVVPFEIHKLAPNADLWETVTMTKRRLRIVEKGLYRFAVCERCNSQFKSSLRYPDAAKEEIRQQF